MNINILAQVFSTIKLTLKDNQEVPQSEIAAFPRYKENQQKHVKNKPLTHKP